uniref:Uncharacterized protein n=1 Tax=Paenibacillus brasilensis TaxID=128574 RepID=A0A3Q8H8K8_9BACL|nr:hypothetical protein PB24_3309 [Paenibacillus brasilensis]
MRLVWKKKYDIYEAEALIREAGSAKAGRFSHRDEQGT